MDELARSEKELQISAQVLALFGRLRTSSHLLLCPGGTSHQQILDRVIPPRSEIPVLQIAVDPLRAGEAFASGRSVGAAHNQIWFTQLTVIR